MRTVIPPGKDKLRGYMTRVQSRGCILVSVNFLLASKSMASFWCLGVPIAEKEAVLLTMAPEQTL